MSNAIEITKANFDSEVTSASFPALVDFFAEWCGPCKMMGPVLDQIAAERQGSLKVCKVDTDGNGELAASYDISSIPCIILFKNGKELGRKIGACSKDELLSWVDESVAE